MDAVALLALAARLVLAGVFAVSGASKLLDHAGARQGVRDFGVPARLAPAVVVALPLAELALALALLSAPFAWPAGIAAAALLAAFTIAIARNLVLGRTPDCRCFGQIAAGPIGRGTLVRNGVFLVLAGLVIGPGPDPSAPDVYALAHSALANEPIAVAVGAVLLVALALQTRFLGQLLAQNGRLLLRLDELERSTDRVAGAAPAPTVGLPAGTRAPEFTLAGLHGETLTLASLTAAGLPVLLVLGDPGCGPCNALLPDVGRWQREHAGRLTVAVVTRGTREANRSKAAEHGLGRVLLQKDREVAESYRAPGTPSAVAISPDGLIASPVAEGAAAIAVLVARTAGVELAAPVEHHHGPPATLGQPAPALRLRDLEGRSFDLATLRGERALVLFWDPGCGFCAQLLGNIRAWEADPPRGAPRLVVVSAGSVEANRALGLRAPVLIDASFAVGHAFGATGTPSAILVDADGTIASTVAAGGPAVMALAAQRTAVQ